MSPSPVIPASVRRVLRVSAPLVASVGCVFVLLACLRRDDVDPRRIEWKPVDSVNAALPESIRVHAFESDGPPLRAWYVRIRESDPDVRTHVVAADDDDQRETCTEIAKRTNAAVVLNAGYFGADGAKTYHSGLLLENGRLDTAAFDYQTREDPNSKEKLRYELTRGAIGFSADDHADIAYCQTKDKVVYEVPEPVNNELGRPATRVPREHWRVWDVVDAVQAGPVLVRDGVIDVTDDEEVFFGTTIPLVHPRSAAGITADGDVILMVVEGRRPESRGVDLQELALLMHAIGCVEALNLDGGGSSALVVNGQRLNDLPVGQQHERAVASALVVDWQR
ncbi:MAG: phosphodiester glycosidase family protein [Planctomycetes bacterium]|nr:phosphodiester glycosidase family protein [Planctomycetota bacterium]